MKKISHFFSLTALLIAMNISPVSAGWNSPISMGDYPTNHWQQTMAADSYGNVFAVWISDDSGILSYSRYTMGVWSAPIDLDLSAAFDSNGIPTSFQMLLAPGNLGMNLVFTGQMSKLYSVRFQYAYPADTIRPVLDNGTHVSGLELRLLKQGNNSNLILGASGVVFEQTDPLSPEWTNRGATSGGKSMTMAPNGDIYSVSWDNNPVYGPQGTLSKFNGSTWTELTDDLVGYNRIICDGSGVVHAFFEEDGQIKEQIWNGGLGSPTVFLPEGDIESLSVDAAGNPIVVNYLDPGQVRANDTVIIQDSSAYPGYVFQAYNALTAIFTMDTDGDGVYEAVVSDTSQPSAPHLTVTPISAKRYYPYSPGKGGKGTSATYTVRNDGSSSLSYSVPFSMDLLFQVRGATSGELAPGESATFTINFMGSLKHNGTFSYKTKVTGGGESITVRYAQVINNRW